MAVRRLKPDLVGPRAASTPGPSYRIGVAARLAGVSEELIRAWERRHGVVQSRRTPAGYRVFTEEDISVLRRMKALTDEGVAISDARRLLPRVRREVRQGRPAEPTSRRPVADPAFWQDQVIAAAERSNAPAIGKLLDAALAQFSPLEVFAQRIFPLMVEVGQRWESGALSIAAEHLITHAVWLRLARLLVDGPSRGGPHVLCACFPGEAHEIGLLELALRLQHVGARVTYLGRNMPAEELARVVKASKPDRLVLSASHDPGRTAFRRQLLQLKKHLGAGRHVVLGGRAVGVHQSLCESMGFRVSLGPDGWREVVGER